MTSHENSHQKPSTAGTYNNSSLAGMPSPVRSLPLAEQTQTTPVPSNIHLQKTQKKKRQNNHVLVWLCHRRQYNQQKSSQPLQHPYKAILSIKQILLVFVPTHHLLQLQLQSLSIQTCSPFRSLNHHTTKQTMTSLSSAVSLLSLIHI